MPEPRRFHQVSDFFLESPLDLGSRRVQRGFLVHGGRAADGTTLDDLWLFDVSNLDSPDPDDATSTASRCPWVLLNEESGAARRDAGMTWDRAGDRMLMAGGFVESELETRATTSIVQLTASDIEDGAAWSSAGTLPSVDYGAAELGDGGTGLYPPGAACVGTTWEVPCKWDSLAWFAVAAAVLTADDDIVCDLDGTLQDWEVDLWGTADPCTGMVTCKYEDVTYEYEAYYGDVCEEDPYCTDGVGELGVSATAPGLAQGGLATDPETGLSWWIGGTTGCEGGGCDDWQALGELDMVGAESLTMASADPVISIDGSSATLEAQGGSVSRPVDWPDSATIGRRAAAVAPVGLSWSNDTRTWSSSSFGLALVGGTRHQDLGLGIEHVLSCFENDDEQDALVCNICFKYEDTWVSVTSPDSSELDGLITGESALAVLDPETLSYSLAGSGLGGLVHPAAAAWSASEVLVVGGIDESGDTTDQVGIYDTASHAWAERLTASDLPSVHGARVVVDPVSRRGFVFGGSDSSSTVWVVQDDSTRAQGADTELWLQTTDGSWSTTTDQAPLGLVDVLWEWDELGERWLSTTSFTLEVNCTDDDGQCWTQQLELETSTERPEEHAATTVEVTYGDESAGYIATATFSDPDHDTRLKIQLPRIITDGDELTVSVTIQHADPADLGSIHRCTAPTEEDVSGRSMCSFAYGATGEGQVLAGVPAPPPLYARLEDGDDGPRYLDVRTEVVPPDGWTAVAPGNRDSTGRWSYGIMAYFHPVYYRALAFSELDAFEPVPVADSTQVYVYADPGIDESTGIADYASDGSTESGVGRDAAFLGEQVGDLPRGDHHLVLLRAGESDDLQTWGSATHGFSWVFAGASDGSSLAFDPEWVAVHELAHAWFDYGLGHRSALGRADEVRWLSEGGSDLLSAMAHPDGWESGYTIAEQMHFDALEWAQRECTGQPTDLERDSDDEWVVYGLGQLTLATAKLLYDARAPHGSDPDYGFWWYLFNGFTADMSPDQVEWIFESSLDLDGFYSEWIEEGRHGPALPAMGGLVWESVSDTGDTGGTEELVGVEVAQRQIDLVTLDNGCAIDAPTFSMVPVHLACGTVSDGSVLPFDECTASLEEVADPPLELTTASTVFTLTPGGTLEPGAEALPATVGLLDASGIVPGAAPPDSLSYWDHWWRRVCDPALPTGSCGDDSDGDGWVNGSDCDDGDASVHPGASDGVDLDGVDTDCDGWYLSLGTE